MYFLCPIKRVKGLNKGEVRVRVRFVVRIKVRVNVG